MGTARGVNEDGKITISLGTGNLATLKGVRFEKYTDTSRLVYSIGTVSSDGE